MFDALVLAMVPWIRERWLPKIELAAPPADLGLEDPCILWHGCRTYDGYPQAWVEGKTKYLHRHAWEQRNRVALGKGRDGHHLCYRRNCFQPTHIANISREENRGPSWYKAACPVAAEELVALYDLYAYEMQRLGYVVGVAETAIAANFAG